MDCHQEHIQARKQSGPLRKSRKVAVKPNHPDHASNLVRLRKVQGQITGIGKMLDERRYCMEILIQLRAAGSALKAIEGAGRSVIPS